MKLFDFIKGLKREPASTQEPRIPRYQVLGWAGGNHYFGKFDLASFRTGYLNVWLEYSDLYDEFLKRHMEGYVSGFRFVAMRSMEDEKPGTNIIFKPAPEHHADVPGVELLPSEAVIGVMDFDFNCQMVVSFRPSLHSVEGMVPLYEHEI